MGLRRSPTGWRECFRVYLSQGEYLETDRSIYHRRKLKKFILEKIFRKELYKNQPLFNEVNSFLNQNNFELFDIKRYFWKKKQYKNLSEIRSNVELESYHINF